MTSARLNRTVAFYTAPDASLFWEMTVCQSLADPASPAMQALVEPAPYGTLLARWLVERGVLSSCKKALEVGGGHGSLMQALLAEVAAISTFAVLTLGLAVVSFRKRLG